MLSAGVLRSGTYGARKRLDNASLQTSTGFLAALVTPQADAGFRWIRMAKMNGHAVSVYAFRGEIAQGLLLADSKGSVRVPFRGLLYADAATGALVWVQIECTGIPAESEYSGADISVEFRSFDVAGRRINLPSRSRVHLQMKQADTTNEAEYSAYRLAEFGSDTKIRFGDESSEGNR